MAEQTTVTLPLPAAETLQLRDLQLTPFEITTDQEQVYWTERLKANKGGQGRVEGVWKSFKEPLLQGIDRLTAFFNPILKPMRDEEAHIKAALIAYNNRLTAARKAEQDAAFRAAEAERTRMQKRIEKAHARGDTDAAAEIEQQQLRVVAPVVAPGLKVSGAVFREVWTFRIVDPSKVPCTYHKLDEAKMRRQVNATRSETDIPGVEVYLATTLAVTAKP